MSLAGVGEPGSPAQATGRYGLLDLLRSEWIKLLTVRSTMWSLGLVLVLGVGLGALATAETRAHWASMSFVERLTFDATRQSLVGVFFAQLVIGVLGVLVMSAEYGTGTIRASLAAAPRRPLLLTAKSLVFAAVSLVVSEIVAFVAYFLGQALLSAPAPHTTLSSPGALRAVIGSGIYLCLLGLLGLGLAAIIRHTAGAIGAFVGILLVLPLIIAPLPHSISSPIERYLPANIGASVVSAHAGGVSLSPWVGIAVLCAYAAAALVIGGVVLVRSDA